jgi:hypothetical protein
MKTTTPPTHPSPAHYWRIASLALGEEQSTRLASMREIDGMLALNRLTLGSRANRTDRFEKDSEMVLMAGLFARAYGSRL